jgi:hypothetical protein
MTIQSGDNLAAAQCDQRSAEQAAPKAFDRIMAALEKWRTADHEDQCLLSRHEVIEIIHGVTGLQVQLVASQPLYSRRELEGGFRALREALDALYEATEEYSDINNLGGCDNQVMRQSRHALRITKHLAGRLAVGAMQAGLGPAKQNVDRTEANHGKAVA